jgi:IPT/TIG domain
MTNGRQIGIALLVLSLGLVGCGDERSPTALSAPSPPTVPQPSPQPTAIQPTITAIAPQVGSTRGGAWATITGADFQPGAKVRLGDTTVSSWTRDSSTIAFSGTAAHGAGTQDTDAAHFGRSIKTMSEFSRMWSNTISFPSGVMSNV